MSKITNKIIKEVNKLLDTSEEYLRPNVLLQNKWKLPTKTLYDSLKLEESSENVDDALQTLIISNVDSEQIWQQLELQNQLIFISPDSIDEANENNICLQIAHLCNLLQEGHLDFAQDINDEKEFKESSDEDLDNNSQNDSGNSSKENVSDYESISIVEDIIAEELEDELSDSDNEIKSKSCNTKNFSMTEVDTKFFKLRESEWIADNDLIKDEGFSDLDLMASDSESDDQEHSGAMYEEFFDPPEDAVGKTKNIKMKRVHFDDGDDVAQPKKVTLENSASDNEDDVPLLGNKRKRKKSTFEAQMEKEQKLIENLENENIAEKSWYLKGEVVAVDRPENSTLEEDLEVDIAVRHRPIITEDITKEVEKIILNCVKNKAWDDVERKIKPTVDPFEYKKKLILEQDKSKKSLADIYEELHSKHFHMHAHHKPEAYRIELRLARPELVEFVVFLNLTKQNEVLSNIRQSTQTEESVKGDLKSRVELTETDRRRERRRKKAFQRKKSKLNDAEFSKKLKWVGKSGRLGAASSANIVQKAVKSGQIKLLRNSSLSTTKSSESFFKNLQSQSETQVHRRKKKKNDRLSATKILL